MTRFYIGLHHPSHSWPFLHSLISINTIEKRQRPFLVNNWILDSGAFTELSTYGFYRNSPDKYAALVKRWAGNGNLQAAITQDYMCEPFILQKTDLTITRHQELTIERYRVIRNLCPNTYIMPVLQGWLPQEYIDHIEMYAEDLESGAWVGVGSVCKRNSNPDAIEDLLLAIKQARPDLRLHGFGIKKSAIERPTVRELLYSADSMAWSLHARKNDPGHASDPRHALEYAAEIQMILKEPQFVQNQLFNDWIT